MASKVTVLCGGQSIDWNYVGTVGMYFQKKEKLLLEPSNCAGDVNRVYYLFLTFQKQYEDIRNKFLYVLDNARPYLATNPRDKVFALLAHSTAYTEDGKAFMEPDYSKSLLQVYRDLGLRMMDCDKSLEVLSAVQHDPDLKVIDEAFPSWVPRWDQYHSYRMLGRYSDKHFAGGNSEHIVTSIEDINILKVQGIFFDTIPTHSKILKSADFNLPPTATTGTNLVQGIWVASGCSNTTETYPPGGGSRGISHADILYDKQRVLWTRSCGNPGRRCHLRAFWGGHSLLFCGGLWWASVMSTSLCKDRRRGPGGRESWRQWILSCARFGVEGRGGVRLWLG